MPKNIVVIGAGAAGLVCANLLAKKTKHKVTLIEAHNLVGGLSQAWTKPVKLTNGKTVKLTSELTHAMSDMHKGGENYKFLKELGVNWNNIGEWKSAQKFAQFITPKGKIPDVPSHFPEFSKLLNKYKGGKEFIQFLEKLNAERILKDPKKKKLEEKWIPWIDNKLPKFIQFPAKAYIFLRTRPLFVKYRNKTFQQIMDKFLKDKEIKYSLSSIIHGYVGLPPKRASGILSVIMLLSYEQGGGPQAPATNSYQALHNELAETFKRNGGILKLNTKMTDIVVKDNKVTGVKINDKEILLADIVVGAGDFKKMLEPIRENLPKKYVKKIDKYKMSLSFFGAHIMTDLPIKNKLNYAANVLGHADEALDMEKFWADFPKKYLIYVHSGSVLRPDSKLITDMQGKPIKDLHVIDLFMTGSNYQQCKELRKNKKKYEAMKDKHTQSMIKIADKLILPGLKDHVLYKETFTSVTFERFCHTTHGAVLSLEPTPQQFYPNRPEIKTPIEGLYLTGAAILTAGVGGAMLTGRMTAEEIIKEIKK